MAVSDYYRNMSDVRLKPRLLKSLIHDRLPDEKHPFPSYFELSSVISSLKIHGLLSESFPESTVDPKLVENWKSAIDAWVDRLLSLASSKMPDKCWAGIGLLGVTFQECSSDRFLASYSVWFQKLLPQIQLPSDSNFVKLASCTALSDMFTRLGGFSNVKKDGTSQAGKLVQPILKLLSEDGSEAVLERATDLLCTLITFFPSSVHRHYDYAESVIVSKIMSGKCSATMSKKLAQNLAFLPKARGDEDSWSLMMQKVLISVTMNLNDAFQGLEEETKSHETVRLLIPPGKDFPPPLGGQSVLGTVSVPATKWFGQLLIPRVSTLMHCVCLMLTNPYPVQVTVPVPPLLALVRRILAVDGSLSEALLPFVTVMQQEFICSELPLLHLCSLDLLIAVIKGVRSQLLPYAAEVVRLLTEYFSRCVLPPIRIKVYSIMKILLITMGVGITLYLAQEVISNAFADLNFTTHGSGLASSFSYSSKVGMEALLQPNLKKRRHVSGSPGDNRNGVRHEGEVHQLPHKKVATPISVQIAALQALEALITVGGTLRSEYWRLEVDHLLITVATNACDGGWSSEERNNIASDKLTPNRANFQLTALRALLASLLSPGCTRPPYLSQGLELFRRGKQEVGTKLAEFCAHALLTLEVLIHPRTFPLLDFPSGNHGKADRANHMFPSIAPPSRGIPAVDDFDPDDDLCDSWLGNGEEPGPLSSDLSKKQIEKASEQAKKDDRSVINDPMSAKLSGNVLAGGQAATIEETPVPTSNVHVDMGGNTDQNVVESEPLEVPFSHNGTGGWAHNQMTSSEVLLASNEMTSTKGVTSLLEPKKCSFVSSVVSPDSGKEKGVAFSPDSNSDSLDSLPDIVVGDPDSD